MQAFIESDLAQALWQEHLPRFGELPNLELYMDQVVSVINEALLPLFPHSSSPILTPTMVNNYVKQKLVPPPVKKRYNRTHLIYLIEVALLKPVFSIAEINALLQLQFQLATPQQAYDRFCSELEYGLRVMLGSQEPAEPLEPENEVLRAAVFCLVSKIQVQKHLEFIDSRQKTE